MEFVRACRPSGIILVVLIVLVLLIGSDWTMLENLLMENYGKMDWEV